MVIFETQRPTCWSTIQW